MKQAFDARTEKSEADRSMKLRLRWSIETVPGYLGLHKEKACMKKKQNKVIMVMTMIIKIEKEKLKNIVFIGFG